MTKVKTGLAGVLLAAALSSGIATPVKAQAAYDGLWSVLIITEQGTCDRGYRYAIRIKGGKVTHADPANSSFRINGRVSGNGATRVSVARGDQSANGSGRINRNVGAGRWKSSKGECSGIWQAERRGS
ncbi:hypothetical protein [Pseudorhodoplanes sinuspersici]|uniref:Uncharacterized protein n=1 Tax=Pseudorhodoplanes sinuspersici TaxID=1235591 RepID=A0A1W6ZWC9_9HYPH|nr:hypothetical protein [Pseudorhodoplanes sinuspersici]ARQ01613.1 hypothetical protein CAK95_22780 [Pseudorhodoplanes sinuspersici]RKE73328.1 hypothetical protein DFP91_1214 [Pseudorhodoplanes sinuspersici]